MRGTLICEWRQECKARITPAHAGNTVSVCLRIPDIMDHPRPCGEHGSTHVVRVVTSGSPPPMRGTQVICCDVCGEIRITPAHAGNTNEVFRLGVRSEDHPRPCGEHFA